MVSKLEYKSIQDRGSALLIVISVIIIFMVISGIFFFHMGYRAKIENSEEKSMKAHYLAVAAMNYGIFQVEQNNSIGTTSFTNSIPGDNDGSFIVNLTYDTTSGYYTIVGRGIVPGTKEYDSYMTAYFQPGVGVIGQGAGGVNLVLQNAQGNFFFLMSNSSTFPTLTSTSNLPAVDVNKPIYLYLYNNGGNQRPNAQASNVIITVVDDSGNTYPLSSWVNLTPVAGTNQYMLANPTSDSFTGCTPVPFSVKFNTNETVHLRVTGILSQSGNQTYYGVTQTNLLYTTTTLGQEVWQKETNS